MTLTSYTKHTNNFLTQNPLLQAVLDLRREQCKREIAALSSASDIIDELDARKFRPVLGGLPPLKAYMLKLDLELNMTDWRDDEYTERTFNKCLIVCAGVEVFTCCIMCMRDGVGSECRNEGGRCEQIGTTTAALCRAGDEPQGKLTPIDLRSAK
jgi:hypothetical protein